MQLNTIQKRLFAWGMSKTNNAELQKIKVKNYPQSQNFSQLKQTLFSNLSGTVLEIGAGTGVNFAYYPQTINWLGLEPNQFMFPYLQATCKQQAINCQLYQGWAENLPFADNSIDVVVTTHVLCSVQDVKITLEEIYRVLKPGGQFIFIEHIADHHHSLNRYLQIIIDPVWQKIFDNCHLQREPEKLLAPVGFNHIKYDYFQLALPIVSSHVAGIAYK